MGRSTRNIKAIIAALAALVAMLVMAPGAGAATATVSVSGAIITVSPIDEGSGCRGRVTIDTLGGSPAKYNFIAAVGGEGTACSGISAGSGCTQTGLEATCPAAGVTQLVLGASPQGQSYEIASVFAPVTIDFNGGDASDRIFPDSSSAMPGIDTLDGGDGDDELSGGDAGDIINGGDNSDDIDGGPGGDTIDAGLGADGFSSGDDIDGGDGTDTIDGGGDTSGDELKGGAQADTINGGGGGDTIFGGADGDTALNGDAGSDTINGEGGADALHGGSEGDQLNGGTENDTLTGDAGDDTLLGAANSDQLNGSEGSETLGDTASFTDKTAAVVANIGGANDDGDATDGAAGSRDNIHTDVENITGGSAGDTLTGDSQANRLGGGTGNDTMFGGPASTGPDGGDTFTGGGDDDTVLYSTRNDDLDVDADGVADDGGAAEADNIGTTVEDITGGSGDDDITGTAATLGAGDDRDLNGLGGDDDLTGSTSPAADGADEFNGGSDGTAGGQNGTLGDTVSYIDRDSTSDLDVDLDGVADDGAGGCPAGMGCEGDNVHADVENVTGGDGSDVLTGNSAANRLLGGNNGSDTLAGGAQAGPDGADVFSGGATIAGTEDEITYEVRTDNISADPDDAVDDGATGENDQIGNSIENLTGGSGSDTLTGLGADNDLRGGPGTGNDILSGGAGDDTLRGGDVAAPTGADGTDTYAGGEGSENDGGDLVTYGPRDDDLAIDIGGGADDPDGDNVGTDVENLQGGDGNDLVTGDAGINTLTGDTGNDTLAGGTSTGVDGADAINGSSGIDTVTYAARTGADMDILLDTGQAIDGTDTDTLSSVQNVVGSGGDNTIIGNSLDNVLDGGPGDDTLNGGSLDAVDGADTYIGGETSENGGGDSVNYGHRSDPITADIGAGLDQDGDEIRADIENLFGGTGADDISGDGKANRIEGQGGTDTLHGGGAADVLVGGPQADTFEVRDGVTDTVTCDGGSPDVVNGDSTPAETLTDPGLCETQNLSNPSLSDVSLIMSVDDATPTIGQQVTFTLTVAASATTTTVKIADLLPPGLTYVSDSPGTPYDQTTGVWNAGTVLSTTPESIAIVAQAAGPLPVTNSAEVSTSGLLDPDSTPNNGALGEDDLAAVALTEAVTPPPPPGGGGGGAAPSTLTGQRAAALKKCKKKKGAKRKKCKKRANLLPL